MYRIRALNEVSSEESEGEEDVPSVTKEAQEQHAFNQYRTALILLGEGKFEESKQLLEELLQGDILQGISEEESSGNPLTGLKYACLKNMGTIFVKQKDHMSGLNYFIRASRMDSSDVMLWYHLGCAAFNVKSYELARDAFYEGLKHSPHNWLCIDELISSLYILGDYASCLAVINSAFEMDPNFVKGHVVRDEMYKDFPYIKTGYANLVGPLALIDLQCEYDQEVAEDIMAEIRKLQAARTAERQACTESRVLSPIPLNQPLSCLTWLSLGKSLVHQHKTQKECFVAPLKLLESVKEQNTAIAEEMVKEDGAEPSNSKEECEDPGVEPTDQPTDQPTGQTRSENEVEESDLTPSQENEDIKCRKRRRNSLSFLAQWVWGGKRRSARVRSTVRRETEREEYNLEEALRRLMPASLLPSSQKEGKAKDVDLMHPNDNSMDTMDLYKLFEHRESAESSGADKSEKKAGENPVQPEQEYFGSEQEKSDVESFMKRFDYHDMIDALDHFLQEMCQKWSEPWPKGLIQVYLEAYIMRRNLIPHPQLLIDQETEEFKRLDALITLLYEELSLDCWLQEKLGDKKSKQACERRLIPFQEIGFLELAFGTTLLRDDTVSLYRACWWKAQVYLNGGDKEAAAGSLTPILNEVESDPELSKLTVTLKNCSYNNIISAETVRNLLTSLYRAHNLSNIQYLYDEKRYKEVVDILKETFTYSQQPGFSGIYNSNATDCPDRATQLGMLMDSLWQLKNYQECFRWGEACCHEALSKYLNSEEKEQQKWSTTLEKLLAGLEFCVLKAGLAVVEVPRLPRLVQNLTHIVCHQLESPETIISMPIESVNPWILLQQILQWQEEKGTAVSEEEDELPPYISVLFTAHEFLSRRSWCCSNEGALLLHTMDVVIPRMHNPELQKVHDKLVLGMEQVFYCLYSHPSKKAKRGSLQDHGVPPVPLTWEHSLKLFQFYVPKELPEFDSYRVPHITADVEALLKRIIDLVPPECNPAPMTEKMMMYIRGEAAQIPCPPGGYIPLPRQITSIYYLLGDFYFKNSEWAKSIQHYLLDVCVNPVRLDSWAGMALARGSLLETKLNSCEVLKSEADFLKQATYTQRCYQRALEIEPKNSLLWIEYGSFVYMVHSFCSRLLKQETDSLNLEMFELLETRKEEMLKIAIQCFTTANKVWYALGEDSGLQDERWLHHYMLGKAAEKNNLEPKIYLDHYSKAFYFLYASGAVITRKINYSNPPNLSVEFLEVFYRIHASILKWMEQNEGKPPDEAIYSLFLNSLKEVQEGPFSLRNSEDSERRCEDEKFKMSRKIGPVEDLPVVNQPDIGEDFRRPADSEEMEDIIDLMEDMLSKVERMSAESLQNKLDSKKVCSKFESTRDSVVVRSTEVLPSQKDTSQIGCGKLGENSSPAQAVSTTVERVTVEKERGQQGEQSEPSCSKRKSSTDKRMNNSPEDLGNVRRGSQESSTSVTTETSAAYSSSSAQSSSSTDSSASLSSSSSDSSSNEYESNEGTKSGNETKEKPKSKAETSGRPHAAATAPAFAPAAVAAAPTTAETNSGDNLKNTDWNRVHSEIIHRCLIGLEECVLRFPQHYKSLYRLTHYYFRSKKPEAKIKCRTLLLGTYTCQYVPGRLPRTAFPGLFAERKNNNFFNGVWRIPVPEIDRAGSFASHMSRCVLLLMDVLFESQDHGVLLELCIQLRRTPEADKKYLRDSEREQLSREAFSLAVQSMRTRVQDIKDNSEKVLLDVYRALLRVRKHMPQKENTVSTLLLDAFKRVKKVESADIDQVVLYCQQKLSAARNTHATPPIPASNNVSFSVSSYQHSSAPLSNSSAKASSQTSFPAPPPNRPRGRPPGSSKLALSEIISPTKNAINWSSSVPKTFQPPVQPAPPSTSSMSSNFQNNLHSVFSDPHFLTAAMNTDPSVFDPQVALGFLQAQMSNYQEILRQMSSRKMGPYPPVSSDFGYGSVSGAGYSQPTANSSSANSSSASSMMAEYVKDRPYISITPITSSKSAPKSASSHPSAQNTSSSGFISQSQEKSSPHPTLSTSGITDIIKNKEIHFRSGVSLERSSSSHTALKSLSPKKSTNFKTPQVILGTTGDQMCVTRTNESILPLKQPQVEGQELVGKAPSTSHKSNRPHASHPPLVPPDGSSSSTAVSVLQHTKSKKLHVPPLTSADRSLTIHPVPSSYKQAPCHSAEESGLSGGNYCPPVKKVKDTVSIVQLPQPKAPGKRTQGPPKKEEPKKNEAGDVEIITLD